MILSFFRKKLKTRFERGSERFAGIQELDDVPDLEGAFYQTARRGRVPLHHANMIGSAEDDRRAFR
jgi:hypothetical protein